MHIISQGDPAPDDSHFKNNVLCEHKSLSLDTTTRRRISAEVCHNVILVPTAFILDLGYATFADLVSVLETTVYGRGTLPCMRCPHSYLKGK